MEGEGQENTAWAREGQVPGHQEAPLQPDKSESDDRRNKEIRKGTQKNIETEGEEEKEAAGHLERPLFKETADGEGRLKLG